MQEEPPVDDERLKLSPEAFVSALTQEERMLIRIRDELYEGSWDTMRHDLRNRLTGKPYIFKLVSRIEHDLQATDLLAAYEEQEAIDLGEVLNEG